jgi:MFS family permease
LTTHRAVCHASDVSKSDASHRSRFSLHASNFFLAQLTGLGLPYVSAFLFDRGWRGGAIGIAESMPALGVLLFQTQAGWLVDRWRRPRVALALSAPLVGLCYVLLTRVPPRAYTATYGVLFASGIAQSFFAPVLCGLALGLAGHEKLTRTIGWNETHNHLGEICSAVFALALVGADVSPVFYLIGIIALLAGGSALLIRPDEIDTDLQTGGTERPLPLHKLLRDRRVIVLILSTTLFQFAVAAAVPFAALQIRTLNGTNRDVALYILVGAATMVPVAAASGCLIDRLGRKLVFALAFVIAPFTLFVCAFAQTATQLIVAQGFRGVAQGIFGVAIVAISHDVARGTGRFQALTGASRAALAAGALAGPLATGFLVQRGGFNIAFLVLTLVATAGTAAFLLFMPETGVRATAPSS